jgi:hypothetical protein
MNTKTKKNRLKSLSVITLMLAAMSGCSQDDASSVKPMNLLQLTTALSGTQARPPVITDATGTAELMINLDTGDISGRVSTDLGTVTMARIHRGFAGQNGPALITLEAYNGVWKVPSDTRLNSAQLASLNAGALYVNLNTDEHPDGELRGQILTDSLEVMHAVLNATQEVPSVISDNTAIAGLTLNHKSQELSVELLTTGLNSANGAHIHQGLPGQTGAIELTLEQDPKDLRHWFLETTALNDELYKRLRAGALYLNVHTPTYPVGEVRAQVVPAEILSQATLGG